MPSPCIVKSPSNICRAGTPHAYAGGAQGQAPVLHWLEAGRAKGAAGRPSVTLPACLSDTAFGGPLPSGRAALAGTVRDPYAHTNERVSRERQLQDCAAGEHGAFGIYAAMVRRLAACWTEPDGRMAAGANTTKGT